MRGQAKIHFMSDAERHQRALARLRRATLRKARLTAQEHDVTLIRGSDAVSLVEQLTRESWSLSRLPLPQYARTSIPCRFVRRRLT